MSNLARDAKHPYFHGITDVDGVSRFVNPMGVSMLESLREGLLPRTRITLMHGASFVVERSIGDCEYILGGGTGGYRGTTPEGGRTHF